MTFIIGILTVLIVLNCLLLILLVLVQLPKKDAGAGLAFGGGAADALFGAGSGNALTKVTKWATGIFFALAILLGYLQNNLHHANTSEFEQQVQRQQQAQQMSIPTSAQSQEQATPKSATTSGTAPAQTNLLAVPLIVPTNSPAQSK